MKKKMQIVILLALASTTIFLLIYAHIRSTQGPENTSGFSAYGGRYWTAVAMPDGSIESFLVDTGAVYSSIKVDLVPEENGSNGRRVTVSSVVGKYELRSVDIRDFKFQDARYETTSFLVSSANVLGANVLFARTPMLLTASGIESSSALPSGECVPFKLDYLGQNSDSPIAALYLGIQINGNTEYALLDTGGSDYLTGVNDLPGFGSRLAVIGNSDNRFSLARYSNETASIVAANVHKIVKYKSYKSGFHARSKFVLGAGFLEDFDIYLNASTRRVCLIAK